jgi:hypothetical protein
MRSVPTRLLLGVTVVLTALGLFAAPAHAAKTDVVTLRNGDHITCEITELDRGRLRVKTDDMGTLDIEWDKVDSLRATATFQIEDTSGHLYYGVLGGGPRGGALALETESGTRVLDMLAVVGISRLGETLWKRLDGSVDLSTSYTSSSDLFAFDFAGDVNYERRNNELDLSATSNVTHQPNVEDTRRWDTALSFSHRFPDRWVGIGSAQLEGNRALGFTVRGSFAGGGGRYLAQSLHDELLAATGLSVNREVPVEGETTTNAEFLLTLQYDRFSYDFPKVDILVKLTGYQSLTQAGRTRAEADIRLKREIFKDFNVSLRGYESYDSKPATEGAELNDYGLTFGIGYTF